MPVTLIITLIVTAAIGGWLIATVLSGLLFYPLKEKKIAGIAIQGLIPANQQKISEKIAAAITGTFADEKILQEKIATPGIMNKLKPEIERHVDIFLREKIQEAFPLLYKFMGDKTLAKFKDAFLTEVETLFPELLKNYTHVLLTELEPEKLITQRINSIPIELLVKTFNEKAKKQLNSIKLVGAGIGILVGIVQVLIFWLLTK